MRTKFAVAVAVLAAGALSAFPSAAIAGAAGSTSVSATINGQAVSGPDQKHPIPLDPQGTAQVTVRIANNGADPVSVRRIELSGRVVGLTFFSFDTSVNLTVAPGTSSQLAYTLDLTGLDGQATGLIPSSLSLYGVDRKVISSHEFVSDVRGSLRSVYGLFGLALLILTLLALADVALSIARHRMPANRARRGLRTMTPGIGIGLVLVFTLSALRVWVPSPGHWLVVAAVFAVGFFVLGYLSPSPTGPDDEDATDTIELSALAAAAATAAAEHGTHRAPATSRFDYPPPPPPLDPHDGMTP